MVLEILPLIIKLYKSISDRFSKALYHKVLKLTNLLPYQDQPNRPPILFDKAGRLTAGFIALDPQKSTLIAYYMDILEK